MCLGLEHTSGANSCRWCVCVIWHRDQGHSNMIPRISRNPPPHFAFWDVQLQSWDCVNFWEYIDTMSSKATYIDYEATWNSNCWACSWFSGLNAWFCMFHAKWIKCFEIILTIPTLPLASRSTPDWGHEVRVDAAADGSSRNYVPGRRKS